jgi:hypothetical protein
MNEKCKNKNEHSPCAHRAVTTHEQIKSDINAAYQDCVSK